MYHTTKSSTCSAGFNSVGMDEDTIMENMEDISSNMHESELSPSPSTEGPRSSIYKSATYLRMFPRRVSITDLPWNNLTPIQFNLDKNDDEDEDENDAENDDANDDEARSEDENNAENDDAIDDEARSEESRPNKRARSEESGPNERSRSEVSRPKKRYKVAPEEEVRSVIVLNYVAYL